MYHLADIYDFLVERLGVKRSKLRPDADICDDLGCDGDDFAELMEVFATSFHVDLTGYRWDFHHGPESGLGPLVVLAVFDPRRHQSKHIPVTPDVLLSSANAGKWLIDYPGPPPIDMSGWHRPGPRLHVGWVLLGLVAAGLYVWLAVSLNR